MPCCPTLSSSRGSGKTPRAKALCARTLQQNTALTPFCGRTWEPLSEGFYAGLSFRNFPKPYSPSNSYPLAAVRKMTCASFSISCFCKSVISRTGSKHSLPWTRQCSLAHNPGAHRIDSHTAQPLSSRGYFRVKRDTPAVLWLSSSSRWMGSGQAGHPFSFGRWDR